MNPTFQQTVNFVKDFHDITQAFGEDMRERDAEIRRSNIPLIEKTPEDKEAKERWMHQQESNYLDSFGD